MNPFTTQYFTEFNLIIEKVVDGIRIPFAFCQQHSQFPTMFSLSFIKKTVKISRI